ncbi:MAG: triphosphoribosyl-dephospho-CoA synthase [Planctomycetales bacterium]|nr:triphosphoribosyl-dephospho-CoA synthase [Planctomycetales bacterium]
MNRGNSDSAIGPPGSASSVGHWATLACLLEATASKVGNVHRGADFDDLSFGDFVLSAWAIGPSIDQVGCRGIGQTICDAVEVTRERVNTNTNLGMLLLLAPLAHALQSKPDQPLGERIRLSLEGMNANDARAVYRAIVLATPGGLGKVDQHDVRGDAPEDLLAAMRLASERDRVARQYVTGFADVTDHIVPWLVADRERLGALEPAIVSTHLRIMAAWPDSLIARKLGDSVAEQACLKAKRVLESGELFEERFVSALADLDFWLRADGHRRNPGTSADLVCAGLFLALATGRISPQPWLPGSNRHEQ